jgi:hypothetical protein
MFLSAKLGYALSVNYAKKPYMPAAILVFGLNLQTAPPPALQYKPHPINFSANSWGLTTPNIPKDRGQRRGYSFSAFGACPEYPRGIEGKKVKV